MSKLTAPSDLDYRDEYEMPRREIHLPETVLCAYCDAEMARPPILSSHPMCPSCRDRQLHGAARTEGAA